MRSGEAQQPRNCHKTPGIAPCADTPGLQVQVAKAVGIKRLPEGY